MKFIVEVHREDGVVRFEKEADSPAEALCGLGGDVWCQDSDGQWHTVHYDQEFGYYVS